MGKGHVLGRQSRNVCSLMHKDDRQSVQFETGHCRVNGKEGIQPMVHEDWVFDCPKNQKIACLARFLSDSNARRELEI